MGLDYIVSRDSKETKDFDAIVDFLKENFTFIMQFSSMVRMVYIEYGEID